MNKEKVVASPDQTQAAKCFYLSLEIQPCLQIAGGFFSMPNPNSDICFYVLKNVF